MGFPSFLYRQVFVHPPQIPAEISLKEQTILITGANSGLGVEAARQCCTMEAKLVILAVRTTSKGEEAKFDIVKSNPTSKTQVKVWELDMENFKSIVAFGKRAQELPQLDIVMLNAGTFKFSWMVSAETNIEPSLQVNHLSTASLSLLLLPVLRKTTRNMKRPSHLTFTSSEVHMWTSFKEQKGESILGNVNNEKFFTDYMDHYSVTKLLNVFWAVELASKVPGEEVIINLINPGSVDTGLHRDGNKIIQAFDRVIRRTSEEGGRLLIDAAVVKGGETHGKYLSETKLVNVSAFVRSSEGAKVQKKLWDETNSWLQMYVPAGLLEQLL